MPGCSRKINTGFKTDVDDGPLCNPLLMILSPEAVCIESVSEVVNHADVGDDDGNRHERDERSEGGAVGISTKATSILVFPRGCAGFVSHDFPSVSFRVFRRVLCRVGAECNAGREVSAAAREHLPEAGLPSHR